MKPSHRFFQTCLRLALVLAAMAVLAAAVDHFWTGPAASKHAKETKREGAVSRPVTVHRSLPATHRAELEAFGEVRPRWRATLRTQAGGTLATLSPRLEVGTRVRNGEVLATIEDREYRLRRAEAANRLAATRVRQLEAEQEAEVALRNWRQSGFSDGAPCPLLLRTPQVEAARAEADAAQEALAWADHELARTVIRAPFDGIVSRRQVSPGESVTPGDPIAEITGTAVFEIDVHLDETQWGLLPSDWKGRPVQLFNGSLAAAWRAVMARDALRIDPASRLRTLILEVEAPLNQHPPLLPGTFVRAVLPGRDVDGLLCIPDSALSPKGEVACVDADNRLQFFSATALFSRPGVLFVAPPAERPHWDIVVTPLSGYLAGMEVTPRRRDLAASTPDAGACTR